MPFVSTPSRRAASWRASTRSPTEQRPAADHVLHDRGRGRPGRSSRKRTGFFIDFFDAFLGAAGSGAAECDRRTSPAAPCTARQPTRPTRRVSTRRILRLPTMTAPAHADYRSADVVLIGVSRTGKTPTSPLPRAAVRHLRRQLSADRRGARGRRAAATCCCRICTSSMA